MCTNISAAGRSLRDAAKVYIASVSDDPYDLRTRLVVVRPKSGYAYIGTDLSPITAVVSVESYSESTSGFPTRGLNEKGLAFTWAYAWENPDNPVLRHGRKANEAWDELMRRCATIDEGIELLTDLPRDFGAAGMLADRNGDCVLVEIGRRRIEVARRFSRDIGGTGINVNCWMRMQEEEGDPRAGLDVSTAPNRSRYERAKDQLGLLEGRIGLNEIRDILCDHANKDRFAGENSLLRGHGFSICNHGSMRKPAFDPKEPAWGSVSAEIIDPVGGTFWYAFGWPCGEAPEYGDQYLQDRSWGQFVGFPLKDLEEGDYTTLTGELTPLACRNFDYLLPFPALPAKQV
jgi:hypothetical protein